MYIEVNNCNNIVSGRIELEVGKLNIKYGTNGTGKSTLSKGLSLKLGNLDLSVLKPFGADDAQIPEIRVSEGLRVVKTYDEKYVSDYLFLPNGDELHRNSFEVFLKPSNYEEKMEEMNNYLIDIKNYINSSRDVVQINDKKNELDKIIELTANEASIKKKKLGKALDEGNKIVDIPDQLEKHACYLESEENNIKWYKWFTKGEELTIDNYCPYCAEEMNENFDENKSLISDLFEPANVESIDLANKAIGELANYLTEDSTTALSNILNNSNASSDEDKEEIAKFYKELKDVLDKIMFFQKLEYIQLRGVDNLEELLLSKKIKTEDFEYLGGELIDCINTLNEKIDVLVSNVQNMVVSIGQINTAVRNNVNENKRKINDFLKNVGMKYSVDVFEQKLRLNYLETEIIVDVHNHLSWGEKNVFALCLFMFDAIKEEPDLIILDDPVSSFDINKKHAIMKFLFSGSNSLKNKTVLMLTHDLEPIINALKVGLMPNCKNTYIKNYDGMLEEFPINNEDIKSIIDVSKNNFLRQDLHLINRLIHFRRYLELDAEKGDMYSVISSVFKGRGLPTRDYNGENEFSVDEISLITDKIKDYIDDFDYQNLLQLVLDRRRMKELYVSTENRYEKIEIFRIIYDCYDLGARIDDALAKFIKEAFHIENCYVFQLDPYAYEQIPDYIIGKCDQIIEGNFD